MLRKTMVVLACFLVIAGNFAFSGSAFARGGVRVAAVAGNGLRGDRFACGWCVRLGVGYSGYGGRVGNVRGGFRDPDVWGHWGAYFGPML